MKYHLIILGDSFYGESAAHANDRIITDVVMFHPPHTTFNSATNNTAVMDISEEKSDGRHSLLPTVQGTRNTVRLPPLQSGGGNGTIFTQVWGMGGHNLTAVHPVPSRIAESSDDESDEIEEVNITEVFNRSNQT